MGEGEVLLLTYVRVCAMKKKKDRPTLCLVSCTHSRIPHSTRSPHPSQQAGKSSSSPGGKEEEPEWAKEAEANTKFLAGLGALDVALDRLRCVRLCLWGLLKLM